MSAVQRSTYETWVWDPERSEGFRGKRWQDLDERFEVDLRLGLDIVISLFSLLPANLWIRGGVVGHLVCAC